MMSYWRAIERLGFIRVANLTAEIKHELMCGREIGKFTNVRFISDTRRK